MSSFAKKSEQLVSGSKFTLQVTQRWQTHRRCPGHTAASLLPTYLLNAKNQMCLERQLQPLGRKGDVFLLQGTDMLASIITVRQNQHETKVCANHW